MASDPKSIPGCHERTAALWSAFEDNRAVVKEQHNKLIGKTPDSKWVSLFKNLGILYVAIFAANIFWHAVITAVSELATADVLCIVQPGKPDIFLFSTTLGSITSPHKPLVLPWHHINYLSAKSNKFEQDRQLTLAMQSTQIRGDNRHYDSSNAPAPAQIDIYARTPREKLGYERWRQKSEALQKYLFLAFLSGLSLLGYAQYTRRKHVWQNDLGLAIDHHADNPTRNATLVPWQCLKHITVIDNQFGSPLLQLEFDHGRVQRLKWTDILNHIESGEFISALKTWAPQAVHDCRFPTDKASGAVDDHTFTKLWFKYYSIGAGRRRARQLTACDRLGDGRYRIVDRIGGGGQGTAYLAVDESGLTPAATEERKLPACDVTEVVLKEYILPVHRGQKVMEQSAEKLKQEAEILRKIDHANIVKLLDEFTDDHRGYLVMEYVRGVPLKTLVSREGPQPEANVRDWALQMCDILQYLHAMDQPVVHRDLTPDNLILQEDGNIKLVDFNVAHQLESQGTATVVGKHAYIPPEQFRGKPTEQSDIYALGCTLHFLLTGEEPEPITVSRPRLINETVSESMNSIIATCTALDAGKRFKSASEVESALTETHTPTTIEVNRKIEVG